MIRAIFAFLLLAGGAFAAEPLYLGVLEGVNVRVAFRFDAGKWQPMAEDDLKPATMGSGYPHSVTWTIAFDGRNVGTVKSEQPKRYTNRSQLGLQELTQESKAWVKAHPYGRKLVVVSYPNYQDPDLWKPYAVDTSSAVYALARSAFLALSRKQDRPCDCSKATLRISTKPYRSAHGDILIGITPEVRECQCYTSDEWFLIRSGNAIHFRSVFGAEDSLRLIDAGDYDATGVSHALFFEDAVGDGRDALVLLSLKDASVTEFTLPGEESY